MLTLVTFAIVIGVLVFVHELGHLLAAKSVDIEVPRFSIGFGPRVVGFRRGETEYVISALPLGGYVQMAGMVDASELEGAQPEDRPPSDRDFDSKSLLARTWVISAGVIMNFLFAVLVFAGTVLVWGEQITPTTRVEVNAAATGPVAEALQDVPAGAEIVAVNGVPVETWNQVVDALADAAAGPLRLEFAEREPVTIVLPQQFEDRQRVLIALQPQMAAAIGQVSPDSPAARAGLQTGDLVLEAGGRPIGSWQQFVAVIQASAGEALPLVVRREGEPVRLTATPAVETDEQGDPVGRLGIGPQLETRTERVGPLEALQEGAETTWQITVEIVTLLGALFSGDASPRSLGGPVAIGQMSAQAAQLGIETFFRFMGLLSVNLAVLNLLPIPVLDGGQLMLLGVEGVRGRPLSLEQRLRLSQLGLILVVGIMVWVITNDVLRLLGI